MLSQIDENRRMNPEKTTDRIRRKLTAEFHPILLEIQDESAKHAGHAGARPGGESHFHVRIVSQVFTGESRVARHRRVYAVLAEEMQAGLHALALETLTEDEQSSNQ